MTDLVVTPGSVVAYAGAKTKSVKAGGTITAGQLVYKAAATGLYSAVDSDSATPEVRTPAGIALNSASINQPLIILTEGDINPGATVVVGTVYVASDTAGGIMPAADLETGDYVTVVGVGVTASKLRVKFIDSGVAVP